MLIIIKAKGFDSRLINRLNDESIDTYNKIKKELMINYSGVNLVIKNKKNFKRIRMNLDENKRNL